jgi:ABC-type sugar transport system ATPase subunit
MTVGFRSITKRYGDTIALDNFDLTIEPRSFTVLCGPPKCGKSVLFRLLAGLESADAGVIELSGRDVTNEAPGRRQVGYVPQSFALYPHLTVAANIGYPMLLARAPRAEIARRVDRAAGILNITHLLAKTPDQLSGGEKQRVALARGLVKDASVFLFDDPLVGLDYKLREQLMDDLKSLREELKATFLYATSDSLEALTMAQRLVVMDHGRVLQHDLVEEIYCEPGHVRAIELVGFPRANLIEGSLSEGLVNAGPFRFRLNSNETSCHVIAGLRPESLRIDGNVGLPASGRIRLIEDLGGEYVVYLDADGLPLTASFPVREDLDLSYGGKLGFVVDPHDIVVFDAKTGHRLGRGAA